MREYRNFIKKERLCKEFAELTGIDSVSLREREMADCLIKKLEDLGFFVQEDDAGSLCGGNAGNIYGYRKGTLPGEPLLLSAHMDTVEPGIKKKAIFQNDGTITSDGSTVLGADDVSGIVEILEGIRSIQESKTDCRDIEVLFTIAEELYTKGSKCFDFSKIRSRKAFVLDLDGTVGSAARKAASLISFEVNVHGRAAHAASEPEKGVHAVWIAGKAISELKMGWQDEITTMNIGTVQGGTKSNTVPDFCRCTGEIRSYSHEHALTCMEKVRQVFERTAENMHGTVMFRYSVELTAYDVPETAGIIEDYKHACDVLGLSGELRQTFGGSDNNTFLQHGMEGLLLSTGMCGAHAVNESCTVDDLEKGANLVAELLTLV